MWHADQPLEPSSPAPPNQVDYPPPSPGAIPDSGPVPTESPGIGSPQQWSGRKSLVATAGAVAVAALLAIVLSAADFSSDSNGGFGGGPQMFIPGQQLGGQQPGANTASLGFDPASALHGDFVTSDGSGGYVTRRVQTGEVTEVGADSMTVASTDGYTQTYLADTETVVDGGAHLVGDVEPGHPVTVVATVDGDTATLDTVTDTALVGTDQGLGQGRNGQNGQPQGGPAGQAPQPGQAPV